MVVVSTWVPAVRRRGSVSALRFEAGELRSCRSTDQASRADFRLRCSITPREDEHIAEHTELASTDARSRRAGQSQSMSTHSVQTARVDSLLYALSLHDYGANRLDPFSLRCWIIQRLMLDHGLDHACAEDVFEHVFARCQRRAVREKSRETQRERPYASIGDSRSSGYRRARRHVRPHRSIGSACA